MVAVLQGRPGMFCAVVAGLVLLMYAPAQAQQWVPYTPAARQTEANVSPINGSWTGRVHFQFPTAGYRVVWGPMRKTRNVVYVTATVEQSTARHPPYITHVARSYPLGPMQPGTYRLRVIANGQTVKETTFTVSRASR
jgi:hypothetical protein